MMKNPVNHAHARILDIQRMSTEDGPGLRTTVFFKGCALSCPWCHNPESIAFDQQLEWIEQRCIGCHTCMEVCMKSALSVDTKTQKISISRQLCDTCAACVDVCPSNALKLIGCTVGLDDLCGELLRDSAYLLNSADGGITASGGEAALQSVYVSELFERMRKAGLHTALDTSGYCPTHRLEEAARHADLIMYDLKLADAKKHKQMVGGDLSVVLDNLALLIGMGKRIWIRTPIIPGYTDSVENVEGIARIILEFCLLHGQDWFERWELCAFNNLCSDKYSRLEKTWSLAGVPLMDEHSLDRLVEAVVSLGLPPEKISWTGMTATEGQQTC